MNRRVALQQMTAVGILWGTIGPSVAFLHDHTALSPLQISLWRVAIATVALGALWLARTRRAVPRALLGRCVAIGVVTTGYQLAYFAAVASGGVAVATFIALGLGPVLVAVGDGMLFGRHPDARTVAVLAVALTGLGLLVLDGPAETTVASVVFAVLSAMGAAVAVLAAGPVGRQVDVTTLTALTAAAGVAVLAPLAAVAGGPGTPGSLAGAGVLLHLGLVVSVLAYGLFFAAVRVLPSTHVVILALLEPLTAAALAVLLLGEALTPSAVAGGVLLLGAVVAVRRTPQVVQP